MRINDNGIYRDMTAEEIEEAERQRAELSPLCPDPMQTEIDDLWLAIAEIQFTGGTAL